MPLRAPKTACIGEQGGTAANRPIRRYLHIGIASDAGTPVAPLTAAAVPAGVPEGRSGPPARRAAGGHTAEESAARVAAGVPAALPGRWA